MKTYPCSRITEYDWLLRHPELREQISNSNVDDAQALQAAAKLVELHVLKRMPYRSNSAKLVAALYRQGVDQAALAAALAYAWLHEKDEFEVQLESRWWDPRSTWMRLLVSLLIALSLLIVGVRVMRHVNPELDLIVLALPALLGLVGFVLTAGVFVLWSRLLHISTNVVAGTSKWRNRAHEQ